MQPTLLFIVIFACACNLSGDSEYKLFGVFADITCLCPFDEDHVSSQDKSCQMHPLSSRPDRRLTRLAALLSCWKIYWRSPRWRPKEGSSRSLSREGNSASIDVNDQKISETAQSSQIVSTSWFQGSHRGLGFEKKVDKNKNQRSWVGLYFLIFLVASSVQILLCARFVQEELRHKKFSDFTKEQCSASRFSRGKELMNDLKLNKLFLKPKFSAHSERYVEEIWYATSKRNGNPGEQIIPCSKEKAFKSLTGFKHWIFSFYEECLKGQALFTHSFTILTLQPLSIPRLASYQMFPSIPVSNSTSYVLLAQAGFKYTGEGTRIFCESCGRNFDISEVIGDPCSHIYHDMRCEFSTNLEDLEQRSSGFGLATDNAENIGATASTHYSEPIGAAEFLNAQNTTLVSNSGVLHNQIKPPEEFANGSSSNEMKEMIDTDSEQVNPDELLVQSLPGPCPQISTEDTTGNHIGSKASSDTGKNSAASDSHTGIGSEKLKNSQETNHLNCASGFVHKTKDHQIGGVGAERQGQNQTITGTGGASNSTSTHSHNSSYLVVPGSRYRPDSEIISRHFHGTDHFETEYSLVCYAPDKVRIGNCEKNPGHLSYWSPADASVETLPEFSACPEFCRFLHLIADLTVRVVVGFTSPARKLWLDPMSQSKIDKYRTGTGSAIRELLLEEGDSFIECDSEVASQASSPPVPFTKSKAKSSKSSKKLKGSLARASLKAVRKYASSLKKKKYAMYIETNRHIVFDDSEAVETHVEFFFDRPDRKSVITLKASRVLHDVSLDESNRSILVCMTSDHDFVHSLRTKREELDQLVERFPSAVREALQQHVFLIHHPHGGEKVCSFGKSVVRKYVLEKILPTSDQQNASSCPPSKLTKIADIKQMPTDVSSTRKMLLYTADTCPGSSGAPVIAFTKTGSDSQDAPRLALNLWMHEGKEINGPLNVSVMEACTAADLAPHAPRHRTKPVTLTLPAPGPVIRMHNPTYYVYSSLRKRLESFNCVLPHTFVHSIYELAKGGFFYAGYEDCVRCFYCGVGVKRWAPGDDIYLEHQRLRPNCHFLILQMRAMGAIRRFATNPVSANQPQMFSSHSNDLEAQQAPISQASAQTSGSNPDMPKELGAACAYSHGLNQIVVPPKVVTAYPVTRMIYNKSNPNKLDVGAAQRSDMTEVNTTIGNFNANANAEQKILDKSQFQVTMLQTENAILERPLTCKVCNSAPVKELYLPCGHLDSCTECTQNLDNCPTCCARIRATVKIYFA